MSKRTGETDQEYRDRIDLQFRKRMPSGPNPYQGPPLLNSYSFYLDAEGLDQLMNGSDS